MKLLIRCFFIIFLFGISSSKSDEKTVFIDIDFVLNNSNLGKSIYLELETLNKENIEKIKVKEKKLKEKEETINKKKNISSKEQINNDIKKLNQEFEEYKLEKKKLVENFRLKKKEKLDIFLIKINPLIQEYMKQNSVDIILEKNQIFIGNNNKDITNDILELVNKKL